MAKGKKTIEVKGLLEWANVQLARTDEYADVGFKSGIVTMIEKVLMDSNNYNGYYHLDGNNCEFGTIGYFSRKYFGCE
jgi:hypothetical protein